MICSQIQFFPTSRDSKATEVKMKFVAIHNKLHCCFSMLMKMDIIGRDFWIGIESTGIGEWKWKMKQFVDPFLWLPAEPKPLPSACGAVKSNLMLAFTASCAEKRFFLCEKSV